MITVNVKSYGTFQVPHDTTLYELSKTISNATDNKTFPRPVLLAKIDNQLKEFHTKLLYDCNVEFLDISDSNGFRAYQRSVSFLMIYAVKKVCDARVVIAHSINKNYYCEPIFSKPDTEITDELLAKIEAEMRKAVDADMPIEKTSLPLESALRIAAEQGMDDKVELFKYRRTARVNFYKLGELYDYFYGPMAPSCGYLKSFRLSKRSKGFMMQFPSASNDYELAELAPSVKISEVFEESSHWAKILKIETVGSLNNKLCTTGVGEVIKVTEALHEKKTAYLADQITNERKRIVLIAGPTSSGKTTFATRLSIQLRVTGVQPHVISLDNYYVNRTETPKDADGKYDFETIRALDTKQINKDLNALLNGETVQLPTYNFLTGMREYKGNYLRLAPDDVLIMEGIHALNHIIGEGVSHKDSFRIFISALTQINVDHHNRIPTTDTRLVRRIVRDNQFRGYPATRTIEMWPSVSRGEAKYIFPFQEDADAFFNSALVYEMCVLKQFAEPLLFGIENSEPSYTEARRLIKFLDGFLGASSEHVPANSILREFVGGSIFANAH